MKDVRNSHREGLRRNSALRGFNTINMKQDKYLTWFRWGFDRRYLTQHAFFSALDKEWSEVLAHNMSLYGREDPWKRAGEAYVLN